MSTGFEVDTEALRRLGGAFEEAAARLEASVSSLAGGAALRGEAFGRLPDAVAAGSRYQGQLRDAVEGLDGLAQALRQVGSNLTTSALNYEASDQ